MSFKYYRLVSSTCLSIGAACVFVSPSVHAGFEWIAPKKPDPVPVTQEQAAPVTPVEPVEAEVAPPIIIKDLDAEETSNVTPDIQDGLQSAEESTPGANDFSEDVIEVVDDIEQADEDVMIVPASEESTEEALDVLEPVQDEPVVIEETSVEAERSDILTEIIEEEPEAETSDVIKSSEEIVVIEDVQEDITEDARPLVPIESVSEQAEAELPETKSNNSLEIDFNPQVDQTSNDAPVAILPEDGSQDIFEVDVPNAEAKSPAPVVPNETVYWEEKESFDVVEGFGNDMPLALALRQIVPARYAFNFGEGVDVGTRVSWQGGKPWNEILNSALEPIGVVFSIKRNKLIALERPPVLSDVEDVSVNVAPSQISTAPENDVIDVPEVGDSAIEIVDEIEEAADAVAEPVIENEPEVSSPLDDIYRDTKEQERDIIETDVSNAPDSAVESVISEQDASSDEEQKKNEPALENASQVASESSEEPENIVEDITWNERQMADVALAESDNQADLVGQPATLGDAVQAAEDSVIEIVDDIYADNDEMGVSLDAVPEAEVATPVLSPERIEQTFNELEEQDVFSDEALVDIAKQAEGSFRAQASGDILVWEVAKGSDVQRILEKWAKKENIEFSWNGDQNYTVDKDVFISGTFSHAIDVLMSTSVRNAPAYTLSEEPYKLSIDSE